jgi:hypothetical protein
MTARYVPTVGKPSYCALGLVAASGTDDVRLIYVTSS